MDAGAREPRGQLVCDRSDALGGQAVGAGGQAPHHVREQARRHAEVVVEEDAAQERAEEALDDLGREALCLNQGWPSKDGTASKNRPTQQSKGSKNWDPMLISGHPDLTRISTHVISDAANFSACCTSSLVVPHWNICLTGVIHLGHPVLSVATSHRWPLPTNRCTDR